MRAVRCEICENPLGERINELHSMGAEVLNDFNSGANGSTGRAMAKFRSEFVAIYRQVKTLEQEAQSDRDKESLSALMEQLEDMSRQAHTASGFTYATMSEIAALQ